MPVDRQQHTSFANGEFDPLLAQREDVGAYYSAAKTLSNVVILPQGGAKRREGFRAIGPARGDIIQHDQSGWTPTAPNGGTAVNFDNVFSDLTTTTTIGTTTEYVVVQLDCVAPIRVSVVDVAVYLNSSSISTAIFALQSSDDDITYTDRAVMVISGNNDWRRFALAPDNDLGTHRYWRLAVLNPDADDYGSATVTLNRTDFQYENGYSVASQTPVEAKIRKITTSIDEEYFAVLTLFNADIYTSSGVWVASCLTPYDAAQIPEVKTSQSLDTLVMYQKDFSPYIIQRLYGDPNEWRFDYFAFETVAQFPFPDSTAGGVNEVQEVYFSSMSVGNRFVFEYNGQISQEIAWNATPATNIASITTALEGLDDITSVTVTNPSGTNYAIEFNGDDANKFFATLIVDLLDGSGTAVMSRKAYGKPNEEDLWSPARGYPRCGTFYQGRHWMGGFLDRPDLICSSRAGDITDFKADADPIATSPLVLAPDIDEQVTVENIYPGRNLQIFTSSAEMFIPEEPITPENVAIKVASKWGAFTNTQQVDVQGGTMFIDRNGTNIREYLYSDVERSYTSEPISILASHLVQAPKEMALRRSVDTDEPTVMYVVNTGRDRTKAVVPPAAVTVDRAQKVTGFARIETEGECLGVAATQGGDVCWLVKRELAGNEWTFVEIIDKEHWGDHSMQIDNPDLEEFTATAAQTLFTYTFTSPIESYDVAVFSRATDLDFWTRVEPTEYTLDLGAKTVTFSTGVTLGTKIAIMPRATSFTLTDGSLEGISCYVHCDDRAVGLHTPVANVVNILGDEGFWFHAKIGLEMIPEITLHPYRGKGDRSPTMQKQRIFRTLISMERTSNISVGYEGGTQRPISLTDWDGGPWDADIEDVLFTGVKRVSALGGWLTEPRITISQTEPGPFLVRSITYDVRF